MKIRVPTGLELEGEVAELAQFLALIGWGTMVPAVPTPPPVAVPSDAVSGETAPIGTDPPTGEASTVSSPMTLILRKARKKPGPKPGRRPAPKPKKPSRSARKETTGTPVERPRRPARRSRPQVKAPPARVRGSDVAMSVSKVRAETPPKAKLVPCPTCGEKHTAQGMGPHRTRHVRKSEPTPPIPGKREPTLPGKRSVPGRVDCPEPGCDRKGLLPNGLALHLKAHRQDAKKVSRRPAKVAELRPRAPLEVPAEAPEEPPVPLDERRNGRPPTGSAEDVEQSLAMWTQGRTYAHISAHLKSHPTAGTLSRWTTRAFVYLGIDPHDPEAREKLKMRLSEVGDEDRLKFGARVFRGLSGEATTSA